MWERWDFCLIICCCFAGYPNETLRDLNGERQEGIMVKQIERSLMGLGFWSLKGHYFFLSLIATIGGKEVSKSDLHPPKPPRPKLETIQLDSDNGRQRVNMSRNRAKMAQYHHFWKFLARKHCFGNNQQNTTFSRTRVSETRVPH